MRTRRPRYTPVPHSPVGRVRDNKGPIGPLDPNEPPPWDPGMQRHEFVDAYEAVKLLQSMGCNLTQKDLEYSIACNAGPSYREAQGKKTFMWGEVLDWSQRTPPVPEFTREEAVEFLRDLGCEVTKITLQNLPRAFYHAPDGTIDCEIVANRSPPYEVRGRRAYYQ